mgnify:CR=1 FL=1
MLDKLLHEAGCLGHPTTASDPFYGRSGLRLAIAWARARLSHRPSDAAVAAWLARAEKEYGRCSQ